MHYKDFTWVTFNVTKEKINNLSWSQEKQYSSFTIKGTLKKFNVFTTWSVEEYTLNYHNLPVPLTNYTCSRFLINICSSGFQTHHHNININIYAILSKQTSTSRKSKYMHIGNGRDIYVRKSLNVKGLWWEMLVRFSPITRKVLLQKTC
jgi:hypothetical protein